MAVSVFPAVIDALLAQAPAAVPTGTLVIDGEAGTTESGANFLIVGSNNADGEGSTSSGESRQEWLYANTTARKEEGFVNCIAVAFTGEEDQRQARDAAFAIAESVAALCRTTPSLGVAGVTWTSYGTETTPTQFRTDSGALCCMVEFQVAFMARI